MSDPVMQFDLSPPDVEETEDGGAIVRMGEEPEVETKAFYENIVEDFPEHELSALATRLLDDIERDKKAREKRDKQYEEGIKRTGLGKEAPGGADFEGASKVVHPMLTKACVDFASHAIGELMPPDGPTKSYVPGDTPAQDRLEKADRKKNYMNWQFIAQMPEFRTELEQILTQLPLGGSQYLRMTWDAKKKRPCPVFVPVDYVYLPYAATNFYTAERATYAEPITRFEFEQRVKMGMYRDIGEVPSGQIPEETASQKATDRIEGKDYNTAVYNEDGLRLEYEVRTHCNLEGDEELPYLITIDESSRKIVAIVRNWEEEDDAKECMIWMVEFPFVPWRGAYSIGLGQMIGSLSGAATGALRALLDSGHINNIPTLLKLKGTNFSGQSKELNVAEVTEIEGGIASDDIRKLLMPVPFNPPSPALIQLLGLLIDTGEGVVRTTFDKLSDQSANMPVGTTLALVEQGMKVMSGIHARLYHAMGYVLRILNRINRMYLEDDEIKDDIGEMIAYRKDFDLPLDVVPVANPQIFSDVQRMAQLQVVADRSIQMPDLYDRRAVEKRLLEHTKIPNPDELLIPMDTPEEQNAINENAAMSLGRPVAAFPEQDHLAHLQAHLDFLKSPMFGSLMTIAPTFIPMCIEHIKEHIVFWYVNATFDALKESSGKDDVQMKQILAHQDVETRQELDKALAAASQSIIPMGEQTLQQIPEIIQQMVQMLEQLQPKPEIPQDPNVAMQVQATQEIENQRTMQKEQSDQRKAELELQKLAQKQQSDQQKQQTETQKLQQQRELKVMDLSASERQQSLITAREEARQAKEHAARLEELIAREDAQDERTAAELASREKMNAEDNQTALKITAAEIESGERVAVKTGTGIDQNP